MCEVSREHRSCRSCPQARPQPPLLLVQPPQRGPLWTCLLAEEPKSQGASGPASQEAWSSGQPGEGSPPKVPVLTGGLVHGEHFLSHPELHSPGGGRLYHGPFSVSGSRAVPRPVPHGTPVPTEFARSLGSQRRTWAQTRKRGSGSPRVVSSPDCGGRHPPSPARLGAAAYELGAEPTTRQAARSLHSADHPPDQGGGSCWRMK